MKTLSRILVCVVVAAVFSTGCRDTAVLTSSADPATDPIEEEITREINLPEGSVTSGGDTEIPLSESDLAGDALPY